MLTPILLACLIGYNILNVGYAIALLIIYRRVKPTHPEPFTCGPANADTALILVHGFADIPLAWRRQADYFAQQGYAVNAILLRSNQNESGWLHTIEHAVTRARKHHAHVWLIGHSLGGALSFTFANRHPEALDGLILWTPFFAPFITRHLAHWFPEVLYIIQRIFLPIPYTHTYFRTHRIAKGSPTLHYTVGNVIPCKTYHAALTAGRHARTAPLNLPPTFPLLTLLALRDHVVDNCATFTRLTHWEPRYAHDLRSSHALTNASDWLQNTQTTLDYIKKHT